MIGGKTYEIWDDWSREDGTESGEKCGGSWA